MSEYTKHWDQNSPENSSEHHTGKNCIRCSNPAGTAWSPLFCRKCNAERLDRITISLETINKELK